MFARASVVCLAAAVLLSGCSLFDNDRWNGNDPDLVKRTNDPYGTDPRYSANPDTFGTRGADVPAGQNSLLSSVFGDKKGGGGGGGPAGVGVNSYLWRATLDTVSFMPLASADPFGGVIITDWYSPPETPSERFKMTVYILDRQLRSDGVKVAVFRQSRSGDQWADAGVSADTATNLENAILRKARQLRSDLAQQ